MDSRGRLSYTRLSQRSQLCKDKFGTLHQVRDKNAEYNCCQKSLRQNKVAAGFRLSRTGWKACDTGRNSGKGGRGCAFPANSSASNQARRRRHQGYFQTKVASHRPEAGATDIAALGVMLPGLPHFWQIPGRKLHLLLQLRRRIVIIYKKISLAALPYHCSQPRVYIHGKNSRSKRT
jgi:hypothetical protein